MLNALSADEFKQFRAYHDKLAKWDALQSTVDWGKRVSMSRKQASADSLFSATRQEYGIYEEAYGRDEGQVQEVSSDRCWQVAGSDCLALQYTTRMPPLPVQLYSCINDRARRMICINLTNTVMDCSIPFIGTRSPAER